jgi:hypothetical protein
LLFEVDEALSEGTNELKSESSRYEFEQQARDVGFARLFCITLLFNAGTTIGGLVT